MTLIFTCNGYQKNTYEETKYNLEITATNDFYDYFKSQFEDNRLNASKTNETVITVLRELSWFNDYIFRHVVKIAKKENHIFMILFD